MIVVLNPCATKANSSSTFQDLMDKTNAEAGEVMQCLIEHKNHAEMNRKCAVGIEHHQLVSTRYFETHFHL